MTSETTSPAARIINVGKRKFIPALEVTHPDGRVETTKGRKALRSKFVAFRVHRDGARIYTAHNRMDLVENWAPGGRPALREFWTTLAVVEIEQTVSDEDLAAREVERNEQALRAMLNAPSIYDNHADPFGKRAAAEAKKAETPAPAPAPAELEGAQGEMFDPCGAPTLPFG